MNKNHVLKTLKYWHIQEFFLPQTLESPKKINGKSETIKAYRGNNQDVINWIGQLSADTSLRHYWQFTLYGGIYKVEKIKKRLLEIFKTEDNVEERAETGEAASFGISIDQDLKIKVDGFQVSTAPWAVEKVKNAKIELDYEEFKKLVETLQNDVSEIASEQAITTEVLSELDKTILSAIGADFLYEQEIFQVIAVRKQKKSSDGEDKDNIDMLNSFYIDDLKKSVDFVKVGGDSKLLDQYLAMEETNIAHQRVDIRKNIEYVYNILSPENMPDACWPTTGHHTLVFSQQFAINSILKRLKDESGIYAVNGPPGTGKTTMLRDLIAMVITERAKVIASSNNYEDLFVEKKAKKIWKTNDYQRSYYPIRSNLLGFEMVVASSNNGAVENVTLEIPTKKSIDENWTADIDFFQAYGSELIGEEAWGSGAACLGNATNKNNFVSKFWYTHENKNGETFIGFHEYLKTIKDTPKDILNEEWNTAKKRFTNALDDVDHLKKENIAIKIKPKAIQDEIHGIKQEITVVTGKLEELSAGIKALENTSQQKLAEHEICCADIDAIQKKIDQLNIEIEANFKELTDHRIKIKDHKVNRPSFIELLLDLLFSHGKRSMQWNETLIKLESGETSGQIKIEEIQKKCNDKKHDLLRMNTLLEALKQTMLSIKKQINDFNIAIDSMNVSLKSFQYQLQQKENDLVIANNLLMAAEQRKTTDGETEQSSPWMDKIFQNARARVFVEALNLHKAFIHANAEKIRTNLLCLMDVLTGSVKKDTEYTDAVRHVWSTLFLCIPVVSTTFASFSRLFPHFWNHEIGWLLIDEAGQAPAQAAVGAIMRSKRCIVVGDPLQLEPIIGLPTSVQDILRKQMTAHENSLSQYTSVQKRVDFTESHGTYLENDEGIKTWVGSPLRVHRRCHSPMFEISNTTTYSNMMVHGKKGDECHLPPSQWIDIISTSASGHWINEEGQEAMRYVRELRSAGVGEKDIYLISPFRDVVHGLKEIFKDLNLVHKDQIGTIHTVQGKEAKVVILVLGSNPESEGARIWAASKPNLLNVAVTRAKDRLYIIGNKSKWQNKKYFKDAITLLK